MRNYCKWPATTVWKTIKVTYNVIRNSQIVQVAKGFYVRNCQILQIVEGEYQGHFREQIQRNLVTIRNTKCCRTTTNGGKIIGVAFYLEEDDRLKKKRLWEGTKRENKSSQIKSQDLESLFGSPVFWSRAINLLFHLCLTWFCSQKGTVVIPTLAKGPQQLSS